VIAGGCVVRIAAMRLAFDCAENAGRAVATPFDQTEVEQLGAAA
jgi:hypothetical protein